MSARTRIRTRTWFYEPHPEGEPWFWNPPRLSLYHALLQALARPNDPDPLKIQERRAPYIAHLIWRG